MSEGFVVFSVAGVQVLQAARRVRRCSDQAGEIEDTPVVASEKAG